MVSALGKCEIVSQLTEGHGYELEAYSPAMNCRAIVGHPSGMME
jgi:hypothetical protein